MTGRVLGTTALLATLLVAAAGGVGSRQQPVFDHARHAKVFIACNTCHVGIERPGAAVFPAAAACTTCHDGITQPGVNWRPRTGPRVSNLRFDHLRHVTLRRGRGDTSGTCTDCHAECRCVRRRHRSVSRVTPPVPVRISRSLILRVPPVTCRSPGRCCYRPIVSRSFLLHRRIARRHSCRPRGMEPRQSTVPAGWRWPRVARRVMPASSASPVTSMRRKCRPSRRSSEMRVRCASPPR